MVLKIDLLTLILNDFRENIKSLSSLLWETFHALYFDDCHDFISFDLLN